MSSAEIDTILHALSELKSDVEALKNKRFTIEDIGIGSFVGWVKLTVAVGVFFTALAGSAYAITSQVDTLNAQYRAHIQYIHKLSPPK